MSSNNRSNEDNTISEEELEEEGESSSESSESSSDEDEENQPLLPTNKPSSSSKAKNQSLAATTKTKINEIESKYRAILLSFSLSVTLMGFWLLDSLKDSVFSILTIDFQKHQPLAKMTSVGSSLALVCFMEMISSSRSNKNTSMTTTTKINSSLIVNIAIPYAIIFTLISYSLRKHPDYHKNNSSEIVDVDDNNNNNISKESQIWLILGYIFYVSIESFGSISVAAFWAVTNSNLDLKSAKAHYGLIIAIAQLGAICGATIATYTNEDISWLTVPSLLLVVVGSIFVNIGIMIMYGRLFPVGLDDGSNNSKQKPVVLPTHPRRMTPQNDRRRKNHSSSSTSFMSGVYLILRHNYLLLILGVSCLYEVALTCLDYEFKLVSLAKFEESPMLSSASSVSELFAQFIGRYGQFINLLSFLLSFYGFPLMMKHFGLKITLRFFPSLLVCATILAFLLPNIWVLFSCMAILKAMVYSIFDPAKEILYIPTSNTVKFKAKFWIDVVGERFAKALGSSITNYAGDAQRLVHIGILPSVLTSVLLLVVSILVGGQFDLLVESGHVIGLEEELRQQQQDIVKYKLIQDGDGDDNDDNDDDDWDYFYRDKLKKKSDWNNTSTFGFLKPYRDHVEEEDGVNDDDDAIQLTTR